MIKLGQLEDGKLAIASSQPFPSDIERVEFYADQRYMMLVYEDEQADSDLMPCEINEDVAKIIQSSPNVLVIAMFEQGQEPYGYNVPLIQIGS